MASYLVIREGTKWTDVFRLVPEQTVTIGRAPTNQVVIQDERCSRCHAEVFMAGSNWTLRDLDSRNGTAVGGRLINGDYVLTPGEIIRIGKSQLAYVNELSQAFRESSVSAIDGAAAPPDANNNGPSTGDSNVLTAHEPTTITHRRGESRLLRRSDIVEDGLSKSGRAAGRLCRLAFEISKAADIATLTKLALDGLFEGTQADTGAILLLPRNAPAEATGDDLRLVAQGAADNHSYHRVSPFLAATVMREGEAVLARNVLGDSALQSRDSKGEIHATSVICAPIRGAKRCFGLIHLYSTNSDLALDPDDLEFTLAVAEVLALAVQNLTRRQELTDNLLQSHNEVQMLREQLGVESEMVGRSTALARITEQVAKAAGSKATVLIRGESGVGKELVARAVHFNSQRRKGAFVCLNCAALSDTLLESELFGHERGAFTGATDRKIGKFEAAHQGTLMLDEIGEMSQHTQAKLLRALEGHPFERVGGTKPIKVDVRVIAATNRDLEKAVEDGTFRRDLYFRLRVLEIYVPPLRKRPEDIKELMEYFRRRFTAETGRKIHGYSPEAVEQMLKYHWPGNVRELKNVVERAVVLARGEYIEQNDLMLSNLPTASDTDDYAEQGEDFAPVSLSEMEKRHVLATLNSTD
ncbi:MAG: sigma 54-interacting transcriptional regulator, partial [Planctomycetales bacterium]|nr:sigma 54-interacting transcriptional regulator [Planctomycetales bacterium]